LLITRSLATLFDPEKVDGCKLFAFTGGSVSLQGQRAFLYFSFSVLLSPCPFTVRWLVAKDESVGSRRRRQVGHATSISPSPPWLTRIKSTPAPASSSSAAAPERNGKRG